MLRKLLSQLKGLLQTPFSKKINAPALKKESSLPVYRKTRKKKNEVSLG
jgi:hypothetical protein